MLYMFFTEAFFSLYKTVFTKYIYHAKLSSSKQKKRMKRHIWREIV